MNVNKIQELIEAEELYYIQRVPSRFLGNSPFWWAKDAKGYTAYVLGAERFSKEEAEKLVKSDSEKWKMFKCSDVDERLHLVFDIQDEKRLGTDTPCGWSGGYAQNPFNNKLYTLAQEMAEALAVAWRATDPFALERPQVLQIQQALTKWAEFKK